MQPSDALASPPWSQIAAVARFAPSPHNTQPWRLRVIGETEAELLYEPKRLLPQTDPDGRFMTITLGIFAEAIDIAARPHGFSIGCDYDGTRLDFGGEAPRHFARLVARPVPQPGDEATPALPADLLRERRTSRLPFHGYPAAADSLALLEAVATAAGHTAVFSSEPDEVRWVTRLNRDTLFYDLRDDAIRGEINHWIRTSAGEARLKRDGFSPACLGFPGLILGAFFRRHYLFDRPLIRPAIEAIYGLQSRGTRTVGWFKGPQASPHDWFATGRMLLRLWLSAANEGLSLHPFGSVVTNPAAHTRLVEHFALSEASEPVWLLFRIGYSKQPPRSRRLATATILSDGSDTNSADGGPPA